MIPRWIAALLDGKPCVIFGDGTNSRDFCYVDNIVQANLLAGHRAEPDVTGTVYNCGCNGRTDLKQLFAMIRDDLAKDVPDGRRAPSPCSSRRAPATSRTRRPRSTRSRRRSATRRPTRSPRAWPRP